MIDWSARLPSVNLLAQNVQQIGNTFIVGDIVYYDGTDWQLAQADDITTSNIVGMVSQLLTSDIFVLTQVGFVSDLTGPFTPGTTYYLSISSPGGLQASAPVSVGQYVVSCFHAFTSTSGFFMATPPIAVGGGGGGGVTWNAVTVNTSMAVNNGYQCSSGGTLDMLLPSTSMVGDRIQLMGVSGLVNLIQGAGQYIVQGTSTTTIGAGGSLISSNDGDGISLICIEADLGWQADIGPQGVWTPT